MVQRIARLVNLRSISHAFAGLKTREEIAQAYLENRKLWNEPLFPLFAPSYYASRAGLSSASCPLEHYLSNGIDNRVDPHPVFQTWYHVGGNVTVGL